jgi:hypothetical protein
MFAILAKGIRIAESKYLSEYRKLLPQQLDRFALVRRDFDTSWLLREVQGHLTSPADQSQFALAPQHSGFSQCLVQFSRP